MRQSLSIEQSQRLALTPSLRQSLRILQFSTQELREKISEALEENPFLEMDEIVVDNESQEEDFNSSSWTAPQTNPYEDFEDTANSLTQHLLEQLNCLKISTKDAALVRWLIGSLDSQGFLADPIECIAAEVESTYFTIEDWRVALKLLQSFDPVGIGAQNHRDCLRLQIEALLRSRSKPANICKLSLDVIARSFDDLAHHRFEVIRKQLGANAKDFSEALKLISELNPYPAGKFGSDTVAYVIPEIRVTKKENHWIANLVDAAVPSVRLNKLYAQCATEIRDKDSFSTLISKLDEAKEFLRNIQERRQTLLRVAQAIVARQQNFFDSGPAAMKPMVLRQIAEELGLHESTISRVTNGKYLVCPSGTFELKFFFSSSLSSETDDASSTAIKEEIRLLVKNESQAKPLSDEKISALLAKKGFKIARRTVAKYRFLLGIPNASERKSFNA